MAALPLVRPACAARGCLACEGGSEAAEGWGPHRPCFVPCRSWQEREVVKLPVVGLAAPGVLPPTPFLAPQQVPWQLCPYSVKGQQVTAVAVFN